MLPLVRTLESACYRPCRIVNDVRRNAAMPAPAWSNASRWSGSARRLTDQKMCPRRPALQSSSLRRSAPHPSSSAAT